MDGELTAAERQQLGAQVKAELAGDVSAMLELAKQDVRRDVKQELRIARLETRLLIGASTGASIGLANVSAVGHALAAGVGAVGLTAAAVFGVKLFIAR